MSHNENIMNPKQTSFGCNCRNKDDCASDSECLTLNIIYCADIFTNSHQKFGYRKSETTFKKRHNNESHNLEHIKHQHSIELAKCLWHLKDNSFNYSIKVLIASKVYGYTNSLSCHYNENFV